MQYEFSTMSIKQIAKTLNIPTTIAFRLFIPSVQWSYDSWANSDIRAIKFIGNGTDVIIDGKNMENWKFFHEDYRTLVKRYRQLDNFTKEQINIYINKYFIKKNIEVENKIDRRTYLLPFLGETLNFTGTISCFTKRELLSRTTGNTYDAICITCTNVTSDASTNIKMDHINMVFPKVEFDKKYKGKLFLGDIIDFTATVIKYNNDNRYGICSSKIIKAISN